MDLRDTYVYLPNIEARTNSFGLDGSNSEGGVARRLNGEQSCETGTEIKVRVREQHY